MCATSYNDFASTNYGQNSRSASSFKTPWNSSDTSSLEKGSRWTTRRSNQSSNGQHQRRSRTYNRSLGLLTFIVASSILTRNWQPLSFDFSARTYHLAGTTNATSHSTH